jgi:hypothetical protein
MEGASAWEVLADKMVKMVVPLISSDLSWMYFTGAGRGMDVVFNGLESLRHINTHLLILVFDPS